MFKSMKKCMALGLAVMMAISYTPPITYASSNAGSGGQSAGGSPVGSGYFGVASTIPGTGVKVSLLRNTVYETSNAHYDRGLYTKIIPTSSRPGYSGSPTNAISTTAIYFMHETNNNVIQRELISNGHGVQQTYGYLLNYLVGNANDYIDSQMDDALEEGINTVIRELKGMDFRGSVGNITDNLGLPATREEVKNQTPAEEERTNGIMRALGTIMLQEYEGVSGEVLTALEGLAENGQYKNGLYEYYFLLEPIIAINPSPDPYFLITPNTLLKSYLGSDGIDISNSLIMKTSEYKELIINIPATPYYADKKANQVFEYFLGEVERNAIGMYEYSHLFDGKNSIASMFYYTGPNGEDEEYTKFSDQIYGFGIIRPEDFTSSDEVVETYYGIGFINNYRNSSVNIYGVNTGKVTDMQEEINGKVAPNNSEVELNVAQIGSAFTSQLASRADRLGIGPLSFSSSSETELGSSSNMLSNSGLIYNNVYNQVSDEDYIGINNTLANLYSQEFDNVIFNGEIDIDMSGGVAQVAGGTSKLLSQALSHLSMFIQQDMISGGGTISRQSSKDIIYGEGGRNGANFTYSVFNPDLVNQFYISLIENLLKSSSTFTNVDGKVYKYSDIYPDIEPDFNLSSTLNRNTYNLRSSILTMAHRTVGEVANSLILDGLLGSYSHGDSTVEFDGSNIETRTGTFSHPYVLTDVGVPVNFEFLVPNGNGYRVLTLDGKTSLPMTNIHSIMESRIYLPDSIISGGTTYDVGRVAVRSSVVPLNTFLQRASADLTNNATYTLANNSAYHTPIIEPSEHKNEYGITEIGLTARSEDARSNLPIGIVMILNDLPDKKLVKIYSDSDGDHIRTAITDITGNTVNVRDELPYEVENIYVSKTNPPTLNTNTQLSDIMSSLDGTAEYDRATNVNVNYGTDDVYVYVDMVRPAIEEDFEVGGAKSQYITYQIPFGLIELDPIPEVIGREGNYGLGSHRWSHLSLGETCGCACTNRHNCAGYLDTNGKCYCPSRHSCTEVPSEGNDPEEWCGCNSSKHTISGHDCDCTGRHYCSGRDCRCDGHGHDSKCPVKLVLNCIHTCRPSSCAEECIHKSHFSSCYDEELNCSSKHYCDGCYCNRRHSCDGCICSGHSCSHPDVNYNCRYAKNIHSCTSWNPGGLGCTCKNNHSCSEWGWDGCICNRHGCIYKASIDMTYNMYLKETQRNDRRVIASDSITGFEYDYYNNHRSGSISYMKSGTYPVYMNVHHTAVAHRGFDLVTIAEYKEEGSSASNTLGRLGYETSNKPENIRYNGSYKKDALWDYDLTGPDKMTTIRCYVSEAESKGVIYEHTHNAEFTENAPKLPFEVEFLQTRGGENQGIQDGVSYHEDTVSIGGITFRDSIESLVYSDDIEFYPYVEMLWDKTPVNGNSTGRKDLTVDVLADDLSTFRANNTVTIAMNHDNDNILEIQSEQWNTHAGGTNGDLGWNNPREVLPGGAIYTVEQTGDSLEVGLMLEMVYVPSEIADLVEDDYTTIKPYHEDVVEDEMNDIAEDVMEQVMDALDLEMWVNTNWRGDFTDGVMVQSGRTVNLDGSRTLSNDAKYWLHNRGTLEISENLNHRRLRETDTDYLVRSDTDGNIQVLRNGSVIGNYPRTATLNSILNNLPDSVTRVNDTTKFITNFYNSIDRNIGTWYNEAWDGIGVKVYELVYEIGLEGGTKDFRIATIDPMLTPSQRGVTDMFSKAYGFGLAVGDTDIEIEVNGESLLLEDITDTLKTNKIYIPNVTVSDLGM